MVVVLNTLFYFPSHESSGFYMCLFACVSLCVFTDSQELLCFLSFLPQHAARYLANQDWVKNDSLKTVENTAVMPILFIIVLLLLV